MELLLIFALVGAILLFALIGFLATLQYFFFSSRKESQQEQPRQQTEPSSEKPQLSSDVLAARRLIEHLYQSKKISDAQYSRLGHFLDQSFPSEISQSPYASHRSLPLTEGPESQVSVQPISPAAQTPGRPVSISTEQLAVPTAATRLPADWAAGDMAFAEDKNAAQADVVTAELVSASADYRADSDTKEPSRRVPLTSTNESQTSARLAPWEQPDPPASRPRRSFTEMIAGFMQENNMRWGELASGILIVLSAIGLVLSLRNELNHRIPYFSSLLFLLITAAIIGAGIYTLKRWKLRNTSRGTLIIGLLLIPINFVAACILSSGENRREPTDPIYWTAVVVGLAAFGVLSWYGSRFLLRKFNLGMTTALIGSGAASLVYHRLAEIPSVMSSSPRIALALVPTAFMMLFGASLLNTRNWARPGWSKRGANRWLIQGGIAAFAAISASSIWLIKAANPLATAVAISPLLTLIAMSLAWIGYAIKIPGTSDRPSNRPILGTSLQILGIFLAGLFCLGSLSNPIVFAANAGVTAIGCGLISYFKKLPRLMHAACGMFAAGSLTGMNLAIGNLDFDQWIRPGQIHQALFNGKSGICLLVCGAVAAGAQALLSTSFSQPLNRVFRRTGWINGGVILLAGCAVALVASLLNRDSYFDTMTASSLALIVGLGTTTISVLRNRQRDLLEANDRTSAYLESMPAIILALIAMLLVLIGLWHTLIWNPTLAHLLTRLTHCEEAKWAWVFAIHGLLFAIASRIDKPGPDNDVLIYGSALTLLAAMAAAIVIVPLHSGNSTIVMAFVTFAWFMMGLTQLRNGKHCLEATVDAAVPFVASTGVLVSVWAAELVMLPPWGERLGFRHLMIQAIALSAWAIVWTVLAIILPRFTRFRWLVSAVPRVEQVVMPYVVALMGGVLIGGLAEASCVELFRGFEHRSLIPDFDWVLMAMAAMWVAISFMMLHQPAWIKGGSLIVLWFLSWSLVATQLEGTQSVASALRWLVPGAGLVLALVIGLRRNWMPAWLQTRRFLGLKGRSWWHRRFTARLIDFAVFIGVSVALVISTITVSQVMLQGPQSLGGPMAGTFFAGDKLISFGVPLVLVVSMLLSYAVSERRPTFASIGSGIFQYLVILATVLFVISAANPATNLASDYFIKVLHSSAIGMTVFGFAWYWFRDRIHQPPASRISGIALNELPPTTQDLPTTEFAADPAAATHRSRPLEVHTLINGLLLTALSAMVILRYYLDPGQPAGWLSSIGKPIGLISLGGFSWLAYLVGSQIEFGRSLAGRMWLLAWSGLILIGFLAAASEQSIQPYQPWLAFRIISWGFILLGCALMGFLWYLRLRSYAEQYQASVSTFLTPLFEDRGGQTATDRRSMGREAIHTLKNEKNKLPFLAAMFASLIFAIRGLDANSFWQFESILQLVVIVGTIFAGGVILRQSWLLFASAATSLIAAKAIDDQGLLPSGQAGLLNLSAICLSALGLANILADHYLRLLRKETVPQRFTMMASVALLLVSSWIGLGSIFEGAISVPGQSHFHHAMGICVFAAATSLLIASLWNPLRRFWTISFAMITGGLALSLALINRWPRDQFTACIMMFAVAIAVLAWGLIWVFRDKWISLFNKIGALRLDSTERSMQTQLPIFGLTISGLLVPLAFVGLLTFLDSRVERMTVASLPILLAAGLACFSNAWDRRWLQHVALAMATLGVIFVTWADLPTVEIRSNPVQLLVRTLIVLALAMFVYGGILPIWTRAGDNWLKTFREMALMTCGLAVACLGLVIGYEWAHFDEARGSGIRIVEATTALLVGLGMVYGLIMIAIRPKQDPFSFSLDGRKAYVYLAQVVLAGLLIHLYLSMPWLFQFGLKDYWPYLAMVGCFGGVAIARLLENRGLEVLTQPLFNTATTIPVVTSIAYFALSSEADGATLMLVGGIAYLMIGTVHDSMVGRVLALVFGNLALWLFYGKFENFTFAAHPQLWLIPPAFSALIAAQLNRKSLDRNQLAMIRYLSAAVIYVSSTSEIFISGVGDRLWPPMVLASLSVAGILAGIMLQVRAFLYLGTLFLLMAMISMVSHAHRQFDHVWPWWAFGIAMGIGILVMFGLFEKRKNDLKSIANHLKDWDR